MAFNIVRIVKDFYFNLIERKGKGEFKDFPQLENAVDGIEVTVAADAQEASKSPKDLSNVEDRLAKNIASMLTKEQTTLIDIINSITTKENVEKILNGTFTTKDAFNALSKGQVFSLVGIATRNLGTICSIFFNGFHSNASFVNKIAGSQEVGDFAAAFLKGTNLELDKVIFEATNPKITAPDKAITFVEKPTEYISQLVDDDRLSEFVKNNDTVIREIVALKDLDAVAVEIKKHPELKELTTDDWKKIRAAYAVEKTNKFMLDKLYSINPEPSVFMLEDLKGIILDSNLSDKLKGYLSDIPEPLYQCIISDNYTEDALHKLIEDQYPVKKRQLFAKEIESEKAKYKEIVTFLRQKIGVKNIPILQALYAAEYEDLKQKQNKVSISNDLKNKIPQAIKGLHALFIEGKFDLKAIQKDQVGYVLKVLKSLKSDDLRSHPELASTLLKLLYNSRPQVRKQLEDIGFGENVLKLVDLLVISPSATVTFIESFRAYQKDKKNVVAIQGLVVGAIALISDISKNKGFDDPVNVGIVKTLLEQALLPALGGAKSKAIIEFIIGNLQDVKKLDALKSALEDPAFKELLIANKKTTRVEDQIVLVVKALDFLCTKGMQDVLKDSPKFDDVLKEFLVVIPDKTNGSPEGIRSKILGLIKMNYTNPEILQNLKNVLTGEKFTILNVEMNTFSEFEKKAADKKVPPEIQKRLVVSLLYVLLDVNMQKVIQGNTPKVLEIINVYSQGKLPKSLITVITSLIENNITNKGSVLTAFKDALVQDSTPLIKAITEYEETKTPAAKNALLVEGLKFIHSENMRKVISVNKTELEGFVRGAITSLTGAKEEDVRQSVAYILSIYDNKELFNQVISTVDRVSRGEIFNWDNLTTGFTAFSIDSISPLLRVINAKKPFAERVATGVYNISNETEKATLTQMLEAIYAKFTPADRVKYDSDVFVDILTTVLKNQVKENPEQEIGLKDIERVFKNCNDYVNAMAEAVHKNDTSLNKESVTKDIFEALFKNKSLLLQVAMQKEDVMKNLVLDKKCKVVTFFSSSTLAKIYDRVTSSGISSSDTSKSRVDPNSLEAILEVHFKQDINKPLTTQQIR